MDIAALSIGLSQASLHQNVNLALTKNILDTAQQTNEQLLKMTEAPHPNLGNTIDVKA